MQICMYSVLSENIHFENIWKDVLNRQACFKHSGDHLSLTCKKCGVNFLFFWGGESDLCRGGGCIKFS